MKSLRRGTLILVFAFKHFSSSSLKFLICFLNMHLIRLLLHVVSSYLVCRGKRVTKKLWERYKQSWDKLPLALLTCLALMKLVSNYVHQWTCLLHIWIFFLSLAFLSFWLNDKSLFVVCVGVFDVLAYTDKDVAVPFTWIESDPKLIANPQMVKLHSFDTKVNSVIWGC